MSKLLNIICVDDEKMVLDSLNAQLVRNFGDQYNYEFAESAEEALEIVDEISEDTNEVIYVVISDWLMPGMKGDELLQAIRKKVKNVKTILLTGHVDSEVIRKITSNVNSPISCIFKPWNEKDLVHLIAS